MSAIAIHTENPVRTFAAHSRHKRSIFCTVIVLFYAVSFFLSHCASTAVSTSCALWGLGEMEIGSARPCAAMTPVALLFHFHIFNSGRSSTCLSCTYTCRDIFCRHAQSASDTHTCVSNSTFSPVSPARDDGRVAGKRESAVLNLHLEKPAIYSTANARGTTRRRADAGFLNCTLQLVPRRSCVLFFFALVPHCYMHQILPQWHAGAFFIPTYIFPLFEFRACSATE